MRPVLLSFHAPILGDITFPAYFTLLTIGFAVALLLTVREAPKIGLDRERIVDTNLWMVVWGIIGARVLHVLADGHLGEYVNLCLDPKKVPAVDALVRHCTADAQCGYDYLCDLARNTCYPPQDCLAAIKIWRGGLAYYGGLIFAVAFAIYFVRKHRMPFLRVADLASPGIIIGLFFGRLGCYLNGCCHGKLTSSAIGVVFPRHGAVWRTQFEAGLITSREAARAVHPTQLYESIACLAVFALLYFLVRPLKRRDGQVFGWMLILYGIARSAIEIFRDDDRGVFFGGWLSTSQIISLPLIVLGAWILWRLRRPLAVTEVAGSDDTASPAAPAGGG